MILAPDIIEQYQGLIFDMDGTLIDTMPSHAKAWEMTGEILGYPLDGQIMYELAGATTDAIAQEAIKRFGIPPHLHAQIVQIKRKLGRELSLKHSVLLPTFEIIQAYFGKIPLAIGTGSNPILAAELLDKFHLRPYFTTIVDASHVTHHKPHPETFLLCAERMGVEPTRCLVFEDADLGIQAAQDGGMDAFDVRTNQLVRVFQPKKRRTSWN